MMMNDKRKREKIAIFDIICRIVEGGRRGQTARAIYLEGIKKERERRCCHTSR